ncbi:MAG: adenylate/guanylate cyclase domain-containing protein [Vicinamibacterales bacterium]
MTNSQTASLRKVVAGLLLGSGSAVLVWLLTIFGWVEPLELKSYDWRIRQAVTTPPSVNPDIVMVGISDTSIRDLAPFFGRWPWPRLATAALVDFLNRGPAKVIAIDVSFLESQHNLSFTLGDDGPVFSGDQSDGMLAAAIAKRPNVILLADAVYGGLKDAKLANAPASWRSLPYRLGPAIEERPLVVPPIQSLTDAAAGLAHNFLALDADGPARRVPPFIRSGDRYMPNLGVAAALMAMGTRPEDVVLSGDRVLIGGRPIPLVATKVEELSDNRRTHDQLAMLINYQAPVLIEERSPYTMYEARHLIGAEDQLQRGETPDLDPAVFKDKIVFIGLTASGLVDVFQTPFGRSLMPGIQLHASIADSILANRFVRPAPPRTGVVVVLAAGVGIGLLSAFTPFSAALIGSLVALGAWSGIALQRFGHGLWLPMAGPLLAIALALFGGTAYRYFVEDREKRMVKGLFGRYVSKDVYDQLLDNPGLAQLGGRRRQMTVLFSDIRGFTAITEKGEPEELVGQLNEYFGRMVEIVFRNHGTVDKFVGDMVMALFGAPVDDVNHAEHAVVAATEMVWELGVLNDLWASQGRARLDIGIGVNSGDMIAGNIGSSSIMSYTVIGDNVNLGSRLESLTKDYRTRIIISDATRSQLTGSYQLRPLGNVVVKGKTRAVAIFEVVVPSPFPAVHEDV